MSPTDAYLRKPIDADARIYVAPNLAILNEILSERIQLQIVEEVKQKSFTTTDSMENATHILTFYFGQSIPLKHDMVKTVETPAAEQEEKVEKSDGTIEIVKTKIPASSSTENVSVVTQPRLLVLQVRENTAEKVLVWHSETFSYVASVKEAFLAKCCKQRLSFLIKIQICNILTSFAS